MKRNWYRHRRQKRRKTWFLTVALVAALLAAGGSVYLMRGERMRFVRKLGSGINMGNSLDAANLWEYRPDAPELEYETFWNNPGIDREQFRTIYSAGFRTVRLPVTWEDHMDGQGNLSNIWMDRVQEVVDMALEEGLYVILDTHHETWLDLQPDKETETAAKLHKVWSQIAERYKEYDRQLLFEGMNEPRLRDSEHEWDSGTAQLRAMVNRLNAVFVDAVRSTGSRNEDRYLLVCPYASNHLEEAMEALEIPDRHVLVSIHAYLPYSFCQDEEGTAGWSAEKPEDTEKIDEAFRNMERIFIRKGVPVVLTEFGCKDKRNEEERREWTVYYKKMAKKRNIPCIWWDNGSSFQLLERENNDWVYPELVEELVK